MIGIIVVCLLLAGLITYIVHSKGAGGSADIPSDKMMWVKCNNKTCNAEYQISEREYYQYLREHANPFGASDPPLVCNKCKQESIYAAEKCQNPQCGIVFFRGSVRGDLPDRCPKCKQSATEESRKKALSGQGG